MKYFLLILLSTCNCYQCVIMSTDEFNQSARCKVNNTHFLLVTLDDSMKVNDTIMIDKTNLRRLK